MRGGLRNPLSGCEDEAPAGLNEKAGRDGLDERTALTPGMTLGSLFVSIVDCGRRPVARENEGGAEAGPPAGKEKGGLGGG